MRHRVFYIPKIDSMQFRRSSSNLIMRALHLNSMEIEVSDHNMIQ